MGSCPNKSVQGRYNHAVLLAITTQPINLFSVVTALHMALGVCCYKQMEPVISSLLGNATRTQSDTEHRYAQVEREA